MSEIRAYLEEKAAGPPKEWLRREPRTTHPPAKAAKAKAPKPSRHAVACAKIKFASRADHGYVEQPGYAERLRAMSPEAVAQFRYGSRGGYGASSVATDKAILTGLHYAADRIEAVAA